MSSVGSLKMTQPINKVSVGSVRGLLIVRGMNRAFMASSLRKMIGN